MAKQRAADRSSRLLVKVANAIDSRGHAVVERHLDEILVSKDRLTTNGNSYDHKRAQAIITIVAKYLDMPKTSIMQRRRSKSGSFALKVIYYLIKNNTSWSNDEIATYCGKKSHGAVTHGIRAIIQKDKVNGDIIKELENLVKEELKKVSHGKG